MAGLRSAYIEPAVVAQGGSKVVELRRDIHARLEALATAVDQTSADAGFRDFLHGMARLWRYSVFNQVWIACQRREATAVAGRLQWHERGRVVRDGERALHVLAPSRPGRGGWPFISVEVFDISQTDGPPVPNLKDFDPTPGECSALGRLEAAAGWLGLTLETLSRHQPVDATGRLPWFAGRALGGRVQIVDGLSPLARASTLAHEYAHELLHEPGKNPHPPPHSVRETEAEAVSFVVMAALGCEVNAPTYIAWQGGTGRDILRSMKRIAAASCAILTSVEGKRPKGSIPPLERPRRASRPGALAT